MDWRFIAGAATAAVAMIVLLPLLGASWDHHLRGVVAEELRAYGRVGGITGRAGSMSAAPASGLGDASAGKPSRLPPRNATRVETQDPR
jgi:hypothetical protein